MSVCARFCEIDHVVCVLRLPPVEQRIDEARSAVEVVIERAPCHIETPCGFLYGQLLVAMSVERLEPCFDPRFLTEFFHNFSNIRAVYGAWLHSKLRPCFKQPNTHRHARAWW